MSDFDGRVFRSAIEAEAYYDAYKSGQLDKDLIQARIFAALDEKHPDLDPKDVKKAIRGHWGSVERMPIDAGLDMLAEAAAPLVHGKDGVWHSTPPVPPVSQRPASEPPEPRDEPGLIGIIHRRAEARRFAARETESEIFARRRAEAPLDKAKEEISRLKARTA